MIPEIWCLPKLCPKNLILLVTCFTPPGTSRLWSHNVTIECWQTVAGNSKTRFCLQFKSPIIILLDLTHNRPRGAADPVAIGPTIYWSAYFDNASPRSGSCIKVERAFRHFDSCRDFTTGLSAILLQAFLVLCKLIQQLQQVQVLSLKICVVLKTSENFSEGIIYLWIWHVWNPPCASGDET